MRLLHIFGTFFIFSRGGKTSSADFGNAADDDEAFGVDAVGKTLDFRNFAVGNDGHDHFGFIMLVTGFCMEKGYAAVDFIENGVFDFVSPSCDDFDFGSGFTCDKGFIEEESIDESEDDSVKDCVHGFEHCEENHDDEIQRIKSGGNRKMEEFIENQRRDIHAAGGSSGTDYEAEGNSDSYAAKYCAEENVVG